MSTSETPRTSGIHREPRSDGAYSKNAYDEMAVNAFMLESELTAAKAEVERLRG